MAAGFALLLMLLAIWGWYLKTNQIEVFEAGGKQEKKQLQANLAAEITNDDGLPAASSNTSQNKQPEQAKTTAPQVTGSPLKEGNSPPDTATKININTAGVEELVRLNGIGEVKAQEIVAYRKKNGAFKRIEQIQDVKGIGEGTFEKVKDWITVGDEL